MAKTTSSRSFAAVLALGAVLSALVLFTVAVASSGYVLGEPRIVGAILIGGPLLAVGTYAGLILIQRRGGGHSRIADAKGPGTQLSSIAERSGEPTPPSALDSATGESRLVSHRVFMLACGVALSIPVGLSSWFMLIVAARPLRGAAHLTELGTTWHDNDRTVRPLIGLALGILGCILAGLLVRAGGSRPFAIGLAVGCIVIAAFMGLAK